MHEIDPGRWYSGVDIYEVLRYAGVRCTDKCGEALICEAFEATVQVGEAAVPRSVSRETDLAVSGSAVRLGGIELSSVSLAEHLTDCRAAIVFAATLGSGVDILINRFSTFRMSRAVMLQAAAAALTELYCDMECSRLENEYKEKGLYLTPRFSPGYGDLTLSCQRLITDYISAYKYTGIAVSAGGQMTPMKSVTAIIGISEGSKNAREGCAGGKCSRCPRTDCLFRRG